MAKEGKRLLETLITLFIIVFPAAGKSSISYWYICIKKQEEMKHPEYPSESQTKYASGHEMWTYFSTIQNSFPFFLAAPQRTFFSWASCHMDNLLAVLKRAASSVRLVSAYNWNPPLLVCAFVKTSAIPNYLNICSYKRFNDWTHKHHKTSEWNLANGVHK